MHEKLKKITDFFNKATVKMTSLTKNVGKSVDYIVMTQKLRVKNQQNFIEQNKRQLIPICPIQIAEANKVRAFKKKFEESEDKKYSVYATITKDSKDSYSIYVNEKYDYIFQRRIVAICLGAVLFKQIDNKEEYRIYDTLRENSNDEIIIKEDDIAIRFAMELLIPEDVIANIVQTYKSDKHLKDVIANLSKEMEVPIFWLEKKVKEHPIYTKRIQGLKDIDQKIKERAKEQLEEQLNITQSKVIDAPFSM